MNFVLIYPALEDKRSDKEKGVHECEWCGDNFTGRKKKYCSANCRTEEHNFLIKQSRKERARKKAQKRREELEQELAELQSQPAFCVYCEKELDKERRFEHFCNAHCSNAFTYKKSTSKSAVIERGEGTPITYIDPEKYGRGTIGFVENNNPHVLYDLTEGMPEEDMKQIRRQMALGVEDRIRMDRIKKRKQRA